MNKFLIVALLGLVGVTNFPPADSANAQCEGGVCRRAVVFKSAPIQKVVTTQAGSTKIACRREGVICKVRQFRPMRRVGAYVVTHKPVRKAARAVVVGTARGVRRVAVGAARVGRGVIRVATFPARRMYGRRS